MIDAVRSAEKRVNTGRHKELKIDARFYFVDADADKVEYLRNVLDEADIPPRLRESITLRHATSSRALPDIVQDIRAWSSTGRSIFFLDQFGYKDAPNKDIQLIYQSLPKSEVIVTYNFGSIYDYMSENAGNLTALSPIVTADQVRELLKQKERQAGRYFAGRLLGRILKENVGSRFLSRFFLRSEAAHRDMWFVHYSKVPRSRLVMSDAHWATKNSSVTQGEAGLDMLGFKPDWERQITLDFGFADTDEGRMHSALIADLPLWLGQFDPDSPPTFDTLLALLADNTAATEDQFMAALRRLEVEREIEVWTPSGAAKKVDANLQSHHRILLPRQGRLF